MEKETKATKNATSMADYLFSSRYGSHGLILYHDLNGFRSIYTDFCKRALPQDEFLVIISHYESIESVRENLKTTGLDIEQYEKSGFLFLLESGKAYLVDYDGTYKLARSLVARAKKEGKNGVTVLADMGTFFDNSKIEELVKYESSLPIWYDGNLRGYCFYIKRDFDRLTSDQKNALMASHKGFNKNLH